MTFLVRKRLSASPVLPAWMPQRDELVVTIPVFLVKHERRYEIKRRRPAQPPGKSAAPALIGAFFSYACVFVLNQCPAETLVVPGQDLESFLNDLDQAFTCLAALGLHPTRPPFGTSPT